MNNFTFWSPTKIIFGLDSEKKVGSTLASDNYKKIMVLYGQKSVIASGLLDTVTTSLKEANIEYTLLGGVEANPTLSFVRKGIEIAKKEKVELILAIGGGSVIDSAKGIGLAITHNMDPWHMIENQILPTKRIPTAVILTLSSAGSESSYSHVLTNEERNLKRSLNHDLMRPLYAFENPKLTFTVNRYQTAVGIVDTMMHTLERYFTTDTNSDLTDRLAEALLVSVKIAGKRVVANPNDYESRATLMWASTLSHNGITGCGKSHTFPVHKLEHDISGLYPKVAHGAGMAVLFPAWAKYIYKYDIRKFAQIANRLWNVELDHDNLEWSAKEGIDAMISYFKEIGAPVSLKELDVDKKDYPKIIDMITDNGKKEIASYIPLGKKEIFEIFELATI